MLIYSNFVTIHLIDMFVIYSFQIRYYIVDSLTFVNIEKRHVFSLILKLLQNELIAVSHQLEFKNKTYIDPTGSKMFS